MPKRVFWAVLLYKPAPECMTNIIDIAIEAGRLGYERITLPPQRTDYVRNVILDTFMRLSTDPHDTLVMLDEDHKHDSHTIERLAKWDAPVVGALTFKRGPDYSPLAWTFVQKDSHFHVMAMWYPNALMKVDAVGVNAIAIKRGALSQLAAWGLKRPHFRYEYKPDEEWYPSEDMTFFRACVAAGVQCYCDTSLIAPHMTAGWIDESVWHDYLLDHPELVKGPDALKWTPEQRAEWVKEMDAPQTPVAAVTPSADEAHVEEVIPVKSSETVQPVYVGDGTHIISETLVKAVSNG